LRCWSGMLRRRQEEVGGAAYPLRARTLKFLGGAAKGLERVKTNQLKTLVFTGFLPR